MPLLAFAAMGGALAAGTQVASPAPDPTPAAAPASFLGAPVVAASCEALLEHYVARGSDLVGPYGWGAGSAAPFPVGDAERTAEEPTGVPAQAQAQTQAATSSGSGTNVQEAGVDEPDVVKTDGRTLWRADGDAVTAYDVAGTAVRRLATLDLGRTEGVEDLADVELLVAGDTLVALGTSAGEQEPHTAVLTVDVSDPATPSVTHVLDVASRLVTARQHGSTVRLVLAAGLPDLAFARPSARLSELDAAELNRQVVQRTTIEDWLPRASLDGAAPRRLVDCDDVVVPDEEVGLDTVSVLGFDAADDGPAASVTALAAAADTAYASAERLYLATGAGWAGGCLDVCDRIVPAPAYAGRTHVFGFDLSGTAATYAATGAVDGVVPGRWAMDERDGLLRLALGPSQHTGGDSSSVVTLRAEGEELVEAGRLDHLGPGEQITSVRWFDDLAIVVTFRQVDPLYTVGLADPTSPVLLGRLTIPGFSAYLHPLGPHRMIGVGQGPAKGGGWGAQAGLFNTRDLTDPRRLSVVGYPRDTEALAGTDPRQFTWLPQQRIALTVVARGWRGRTAWVSVLAPRTGVLTHRMVPAGRGAEVDSIRMVPLPDGRVVLSTSATASYLEL